MRIGVEKDVVAEEGLNEAKVTELEHIFFVARGASINCQGRNQMSKNQVLDVHMLLPQVSYTLGIMLVELTARMSEPELFITARDNTTHLVQSSFCNAPYLCHCRF